MSVSEFLQFVNEVGAGSNTTSGERVNAKTAEKYAAVYAAVGAVSDDVAKLPLKLLDNNDGAREIARDHPVHRILSFKPSLYMTSFVFRQTLMRHVLLHGNGYAEIVRDRSGTPASLEIVDPVSMNVERTGNGIVYVQTRTTGGQVRLPAEDVLHIRTMGDGLMGQSPITLHRETIGLAMAAMKSGAQLFDSGMRPGGVLEHPGKLSPEAIKRLRESVKSQGAGKNSAGLIVIEEGMKYNAMSINPTDAQYLETRVHQVRDIARIYRVPPHKLGDLADATFSNVEEQNRAYVDDCLAPWLVQWEQEISTKLLNDSERTRLYPKFNVEGMLRGNSEGRATFYARMFQIGALSINEIRDKEDLDEIEGGDTHYIPVNLRPSDSEWQPNATQGAPASVVGQTSAADKGTSIDE